MIHAPTILATDISSGQTWILVVMAILTIAWAVMRPMMRKKDPLGKKPFSSLAQQRTVERQMQNVLVELSEMTRQVSAQLDTRAAKLEVLLKEADEKIALLRSLGNNSAPAINPGPAQSQAIQPQPVDSPPLQIDPRHQEIYALADQGRSARDIGQLLDRPSGEIELILALRGRNNDAMAG